MYTCCLLHLHLGLEGPYGWHCEYQSLTLLQV